MYHNVIYKIYIIITIFSPILIVSLYVSVFPSTHPTPTPTTTNKPLPNRQEATGSNDRATGSFSASASASLEEQLQLLMGCTGRSEVECREALKKYLGRRMNSGA